MTTDIAPFASPIDALSLIHNALRTEAERVEQAVHQLEIGSSFKAFQPIFYRWALALSAYVEAEARALTTLIPEGARVWAHVTGMASQVLERLEALQAYLQTEIGKTIVIARTKRQLFGRVALARLRQEDLLEDEETHLLPALRTQLGEASQLDVLRLLLIDQDAASADAMVAWIVQNVTAPERQALATLMARLVDAAGAPPRHAVSAP